MSDQTENGSDAPPPYAVARARVARVERVSPAFVRIALAGDDLADAGNPGRTLDQRVKLVFPCDDGTLPHLDGADWYHAWLEVPAEKRGSMRTYSLRDIEVDADGTTRFVVDFVLHLAPGADGPASRWAAAAEPDDELLVVAPRRGRFDGGGIEFAPEDAAAFVLAGDETAAPAIARIVEDLGPDARGLALIEVPESADRLTIAAPAGVEVRWLPRDGAAQGELLVEAAQAAAEAGVDAGVGSGSGSDETYFWIAGESTVVTTLRRRLVREVGVDRDRITFMGYWRRGVAMRA